MGALPCIWTFLSSLGENGSFGIQLKKGLASILPELSISGKPRSGEGFLGILLDLEYRIGENCIVVAFLV